jgi:diguanylate cyclase (GGDEF)-like protein
MNTTISSLSPIRQTAVISAIAALLSVTFTGTVYLVIFGMDDRFWPAINISLMLPWVITIPLSLYMSKQRFKLVSLTNRLKEMQARLREANNTLEQRANIDGMTGLLSRDSFFNRLDQLRGDETSNVFLFVDVDLFKEINDNFGHLVGDQALVLLGKIFRKTLRKDDLIGRIGGEEFGIFLPNTSAPEGQIIGEIIRHEIEKTIFEPCPNMRHVITVSIGVTDIVPHQPRAAMLGNADTALFTAKRRGRNQVVLFEPGLFFARNRMMAYAINKFTRTNTKPVTTKVISIVSSIWLQFDASGVKVQGLIKWNTRDPTTNRINTTAKGILVASFSWKFCGRIERLPTSRQSCSGSARNAHSI